MLPITYLHWSWNRMRKSISFYALLIILTVFLSFRFCYIENNSRNGYNATSWDAFGYYMYLPATFIYGDVNKMAWIPALDSVYHLTGGNLYQAIKLPDGNYTGKYFCGIAILQAPFFFIGHGLAAISGAPLDGFSAPYQYAILFGAIFWAFLGFVILRKVLMRFYNDEVAAITLLLIALASNLIQYVSKDGAMAHAFIFPLYAMVIWMTVKWHERPAIGTAMGIGLICGLAVICRPTELLMIFIPVLWNTHTQEGREEKKQLILKYKSHIAWCILAGFFAILPQLLYWKYTTGSFVFDVGSKWVFLDPWFRVLFGAESGWFLYTPVAILMVLGLFFIRKMPFRNAVMVFCLLNIWVVIAWFDWRYGASYSTRALVQSYPVFALPLAGIVSFLLMKWKRSLFYGTMTALIIFNFYSLWLYNHGGTWHSFSPLLKFF